MVIRKVVETAELSIPNVSAQAGEVVEIPVSVTKNPGIMGLGLQLSYDKEMFSDLEITAGEVLSEGTFNYNYLEDEGFVYILWSYVENVTDAGVLFNIKLTAKTDIVDGNYPINIDYFEEDCFNDNWFNVKMNIPKSAIIVCEYLMGDANSDGKINNKDVSYIACAIVKKVTLTSQETLAADVNQDGAINNKDVVKLARFLVGKKVSLGGN